MSRTLPSHRLALALSPCAVPGGRSAANRAPRGGGLQLTRAADYAVRALIHLALQPARTRLSQVDIAAAISAPAPFVGKVMQQLASAGLVVSQRGIGGGFALQRAAADTTMLDAVTAIEGPLALNSCLSPDEPCGRASYCPAHLVWHDAQRRVIEVLQSASIGALAERAAHAGAGAPPWSAEASDGHRREAPGDAGVPRDGAARPPRAHLRGEERPPLPRLRGRDVPGTVGRLRGTGECLR